MNGSRRPAAMVVVAGCVLVAGGSPALATTAEAYRFVDAQGVELIRNRLPAPATSQAAAASGPGRIVAVAPHLGRPAPAPAPALAGRAAVSPAEQGLRDRERLAILHQELSTEVIQLQRLLQALDHPAMNLRRDGDEWRRLADQRQRHEQNIKALDGEIRRVQSASAR